MKKIEFILKHNVVAQKIYIVVFSLIFKFIGVFVRTNPKQVIFQSLIGKSYGDSPRVLYEEMRKDKFFADYKFVWAFDDPDKYDVVGAKKIKLTSFRYYIEALRSGIWISNVSIERGLSFKPKRTISLNTGHGVSIKAAGNAQKTRNDYDYSNEDFYCVSSLFDKEMYIRDFKVKPEALHLCGMPRNDELFYVTDEKRNLARKKLGVPDNKKIILYAPTWRDSADGGTTFQIAPPIDLSYWQAELGDEYVLMIRMHHLTTQKLDIVYNDFVRDATKKYSINELMIAADILISDYSATIFDFSILEKPIISYAYDLDQYAEARGFYERLDVDVLPGDVFRTQEEVISHIKKMNYQLECEKAKKVKQKYISYGGHATQTCLNYLKSNLKTD